MSFRSSVTIVASPRPRVGKTLIARLLVDYYIHNGRGVAAYDLGGGDATLAQFLPHHVSKASIADIKGQMALFDRLIAEEETAKVVDLGPDSFEAFFSVAGQIGFAEEARKRAIAPVILFPITPDKVSVDAYAALRTGFPLAALTPVHNELHGSAQHRDKYPFASRATVLVHFPVLTAGLRRLAERPPFSFADFGLASRMDLPHDQGFELQRWLRRVFLEFRELELRVLLADLQSSIQLQP